MTYKLHSLSVYTPIIGSLSGSVTGSLLGTASYALTASYAMNGGGSTTPFPYTGSAEITGSLNTIGNVLIQSGTFNMTNGVSIFTASVGGGNVILDTNNAFLRLRAGGIGFYWNASALLPENNNLRDIGGVTAVWRAGYFNNLFTSGSLVSTGSIQSLTGFTGSLQGTASVATTALTASSFTGYLTFPNGLDVTGSTVLTGSGYVLQVLGSASIANNLLVNDGSLYVDAGNNRVAIGTTGSISNTLHVQGTVSASSYTSSINNAVGFLGTASWATNATTASLSTTASLTLAVSGSGSRVLYNSANNVTTTSANLIFDGTNLTVGGQLNASTKSFVIDHKQLPGKKLVYGVVEGPEHSVMVRGRISGNNKIHLPEEWEWLVDMDTVTVQLTSIGTFQQLYVDTINGLTITIRSAEQWNEDIDCYYLVQATRKDVAQLDTVV